MRSKAWIIALLLILSGKPMLANDVPQDGAETPKSLVVYLCKASNLINKAWIHPPELKRTTYPILSFILNVDGHYKMLRLDTSTGNAQADQAALDAVRIASVSFGHLPAEIKREINVQVDFPATGPVVRLLGHPQTE